MYRPEGLIIDNNKLTLHKELNQILREQEWVDIATAYFNISGFQLVKEALSGIKNLRLLIGTSPLVITDRPDFFQPDVLYKQRFREDLEMEAFDREKKTAVVALINLLKNPGWEVRLYGKALLHGKAYIFDKLAIIGSSNFTYAGFTSNTELNAVLDEAHARYIREEWFEKLWQNARDFKQELISILDESKFGTKEYQPFQIFIKSLYELQKEDILFEHETPSTLPSSEVDLANFQEDAVKRIYSRLNNYNGVLIADSVGLGKTWIAKKVIEDYGFYRRKRFVVICPASVDIPLWRPALKDIGVSENIIHQEELGREDFDFTALERRLNFKLEDIALIVVDESHNFRNPYSNRYENLFTLIEKASVNQKPKILLLTATPMNNTHWDLYFQLMLLARNDKRFFFKEGIFDLEQRFKKADKGDIHELADILQIISIRRTRQYIMNNYPDAKYKNENGEWVKIKFPKRKLFEINYSLDETYRGLYYQIAKEIESELTLAYYRLEEYRISGKKDEMELGRMKALGGILQTLLLKRLESSVEAFRKSIQTQIEFLSHFMDMFKEGKILRKKFYNKYLIYLAEESQTSAYLLEELKKNLESFNPREFDTEKFFEDLEQDIAIFRKIKTLVDPVDRAQDAKLKVLKEKLIELRDKGKIILFSFYADTIDYLYSALTQDKDFLTKFNGKIAKITGSFSTQRRREVVEAFLNSDTNLLLSTDILSEGQNLQQARMVINYDLHWNPVRMIQRAGRIDRIGSPYESIFIYNFYPEKELESLLDLVKILQGKIEMINQSIGLDASVLGEKINPKVFGIIRDLRGTKEQKEKVLQELEEEQFGGGEAFWQPLKDFGLEKLKEYCDSIPYGVQSGLKKELGVSGIFFYFLYDNDYHFWFFYDAINNTFINNKVKILDFISCKQNEPRVIPDNLDPFEIYQIVRKRIEDQFSEILTAQLRTVTGRVEKTLRDLRDELDFIRDNYLETTDPMRLEITKMIDALHNITLTKIRMRSLRKLWRNYKNTKNWHILLQELKKFLAERPTVEQQKPKEFDERKLKLICVDFVS